MNSQINTLTEGDPTCLKSLMRLCGISKSDFYSKIYNLKLQNDIEKVRINIDFIKSTTQPEEIKTLVFKLSNLLDFLIGMDNITLYDGSIFKKEDLENQVEEIIRICDVDVSDLFTIERYSGRSKHRQRPRNLIET
ncbi:MAG: hypothetical protein ACMG57_03890 [Candidatus Dojkabacteria bacterium]